MLTFAMVFLGFNGVVIGLIGLGYLYDPNILLARYGLETTSASMDNMLRGAYGGLFVAAATAIGYGSMVAARTPDALLFTTLFMGGFLLGRVVSILRVGAPDRAVYGLLCYELIAAVIAAALYGQLGA